MLTPTYYNKNAQELTDSEIHTYVERKETFYIHHSKTLVEVTWDSALSINLPELTPDALVSCASLHKWMGLDDIVEAISIIKL